MAQTDSPRRDVDELARRRAEIAELTTGRAAGTARGLGERAAEGLDRLASGELVGAQSEAMTLVLRTASEQAQQNLQLALDLMGTRGPDRLMQCYSTYWADTMARAQRFQQAWLAITQQMAGGQRSARR
jgi:hypothetical protein